jgi:uncharacterized protein
MRHCFKIAAVVTGIILAASPVMADYRTGMAAYRARDYKFALKEFKAERCRESHYNLGVMYFKGEGVKADHLEGIEWFRKAADQGLAQAQYVLGTIYYGGRDVAQDRAAAAMLYRKAAGNGHLQAQFYLGLMYYNGDGVEKNRNKAVVWLKQAAYSGHRDAAAILENMGEDVPPPAPPMGDKITKMPFNYDEPSTMPAGHPPIDSAR